MSTKRQFMFSQIGKPEKVSHRPGKVGKNVPQLSGNVFLLMILPFLEDAQRYDNLLQALRNEGIKVLYEKNGHDQ